MIGDYLLNPFLSLRHFRFHAAMQSSDLLNRPVKLFTKQKMSQEKKYTAVGWFKKKKKKSHSEIELQGRNFELHLFLTP